MTVGKPSGNQIAFFILATWLLVVPLTQWLIAKFGLVGLHKELFERYFHGLLVMFAFVAVPTLRRACADALRPAISPVDRREVAVVAAISPLHNFAFVGAYTLWFSMTEGPLGLQQRLSVLDSGSHAMAYAMEPLVITSHLAIVVALGPIMEELLFRAFLFRAWEERYGWVIALFLTSTLFAALHASFLSAFLASILFTCVYRRTRSLWSAIIVHAAANFLCYYPLLGRWILPRDLEYPGDLSTWTWHIALFFLYLAGVGIYLWMSRDRASNAVAMEDAYVALPR